MATDSDQTWQDTVDERRTSTLLIGTPPDRLRVMLNQARTHWPKAKTQEDTAVLANYLAKRTAVVAKRREEADAELADLERQRDLLLILRQSIIEKGKKP